MALTTCCYNFFFIFYYPRINKDIIIIIPVKNNPYFVKFGCMPIDSLGKVKCKVSSIDLALIYVLFTMVMASVISAFQLFVSSPPLMAVSSGWNSLSCVAITDLSLV